MPDSVFITGCIKVEGRRDHVLTLEEFDAVVSFCRTYNEESPRELGARWVSGNVTPWYDPISKEKIENQGHILYCLRGKMNLSPVTHATLTGGIDIV